ncbi:MAG: branched-chain amino acid ABC transporter permease [Lachnospiraceae bacterium]|jgi:branched-chain amino acid transport system permease protein|nr:branched-chain amino acid ABC transporter permease [Lachnospiraceae bacterium]
MQNVLFQLIVSGTAMGFVYALVAVEYTLIWNACGLLNFSHEKIIMLGGYMFVGTCITMFGMSNLLSALLAILLLGVFGILIAVVIFIPLRNQSRLIAVVATVMLGQILNEAAVLVWGPVALMPKNFLSGVFQIMGATIAKSYVYIIMISIFIIIALQFVFKRTKFGKAMTCVSIHKTAASLMGINVKASMVITLMISFMICAVIGIITAPIFTVKQQMATMIALKGFCAGVIGGFGSLPAAIAGGLILGIVENLAGLVLPAVFKDAVAFTLMILFMMFSPKGLVGVKQEMDRKRQLRTGEVR